MTDEMDRLLDLQERDSALARLRSRREEIESGEEIRRLRGSVEDVERTLGELRLANDAVTAIKISAAIFDIEVLPRISRRFTLSATLCTSK